jgi:outer membrane protein
MNTRMRIRWGTTLLGALVMMGAYPGARAYSQAATVDSLTVEDAVRLVLSRNPSLREASDAIAIFKARMEQSRTSFLPGARGLLSYTRLGPVPSIDIPGFGSFQLYPANNYDFHAGVQQLIYDGKRTREAVNLSRSRVDIATDSWELLKRDLGFQTAGLFYLILYLQENIRVEEEHIRVLNDHLLTAQKKLSAGTATELDVLNTQVRVVSAQNQKVDLENALEKQILTLRRLGGLEEKAPLAFEGWFTYEPLSLEADALVRQGLEGRLEMRAVQNEIQAAGIQYDLAGTHNKPVISANLLFGTKNGFVPMINKLRANFVAAVQADIPLFDRNMTRYLRAEATANLKTLEDKKAEVEMMIRSEVLQAVSDVRASEKKVQSVEINIVRANKALEFAKARYEAGTTTNLDLLDTEEARTEAEFVKLQELYKFVLGRLELERATGKSLAD